MGERKRRDLYLLWALDMLPMCYFGSAPAPYLNFFFLACADVTFWDHASDGRTLNCSQGVFPFSTLSFSQVASLCSIEFSLSLALSQN